MRFRVQTDEALLPKQVVQAFGCMGCLGELAGPMDRPFPCSCPARLSSTLAQRPATRALRLRFHRC